MKIKVLVLYPGRKGGGSIYSLEMTKALNKIKDIEISAVISNQQENISEWDKLNINLYKLKTYNNKIEFIFSSLNIIKFLRFKKYVNEFNPDIIYYPMTHLWTPLFNILFNKYRKVITIHDPIARYKEKNPIHIAQKFIFKDKYYYVILSEKFKKVLYDYNISNNNILILPHGIFDFYLTTSKNIKKSKKLNLLFFGKIKNYKGLDTLLKAFIIVENKYDNVELTVAGDGDLKKYDDIIKQIDNIQIYNEWISKNDINNLFIKSDIVVLPYKDASQSGIIPIAFAFGKPVIATKVGGITEQIIDKENGILIEPDNEKILANKIIELLNNKEYLLKLGNNAKIFAEDNWNWNHLSNILYNFFKKIINKDLGD